MRTFRYDHKTPCKYLNLRYDDAMRLISNKKLLDFSTHHPSARIQLQAWRRIIEKNSFANHSELKNTFNSVDKVDELYVFNIGGNKYRLIAFIMFKKQTLYVKHILTHREYDQGGWKS
ncbi:type II toxin-antitoxin system HigB family toxin [Chromobacterium sphagni]|uniref:type II toxin-antitoxin system HigB family toxin n=1 Tax=Chromobacterium sphagni TaxID=1903179 RepID=UPI000A9EA7A4|nr:type II toxin-antitoxin system HigB family toxin [Chromobacterium sphagni]